MVYSKPQNQGLFKFRITVQCHHCSVSWKITPLHFLAQTLYTLDKKNPSKCNVQTFERLRENSPNSSGHIWNQKSVFRSTLYHSTVSWEITLLYFFSWNFIWFVTEGDHQSGKLSDFQLLTLNFTKFVLWYAFFCWKYLKFQLKRYGRVMSHDTEKWCKIWRKTDLLFQKWQKFGEFWAKHQKSQKFLLWLASFVQSK